MTDTYQSGQAQGAGGADPASKVKTMASAAVGSLSKDAGQLASQAQEKARGAVEHGKQTATDTLGDFASAIRKAGDDLAQNDQSMAGRLVRQAADSLEHLSRSLENKRPSELVNTAREFGRRNPVAFAGGAVLLGIALGRFVRSSEPDATSDGFYGQGGQNQGQSGLGRSGLAQSGYGESSYGQGGGSAGGAPSGGFGSGDSTPAASAGGGYARSPYEPFASSGSTVGRESLAVGGASAFGGQNDILDEQTDRENGAGTPIAPNTSGLT